MLAAIPVDEMAETLRVLAGANAANAARHFGKRSFDSDDVASAIFWTNIAEIIEHVPFAAPARADEPERRPVPRRMTPLLEAAAFRDARFEDVDADVLTREALLETLAAENGQSAGDVRRSSERSRPLPQEIGRPEDGDQQEAWRLPLAA